MPMTPSIHGLPGTRALRSNFARHGTIGQSGDKKSAPKSQAPKPRQP